MLKLHKDLPKARAAPDKTATQEAMENEGQRLFSAQR